MPREPVRNRAQLFRKKPTYAEARLWALLRDRRLADLKFRRQAPIGRFVVDFVCFEHKLVVEADGGVHVLREVEDAARDAELARMGFRVLRLDNGTIVNDPGLALTIIRYHCLNTDDPSPLVGEGGCEADG